jgi:hypothetical protein
VPKYQIRGALGGGFGGVKNAEWETIEAESLADAETAAYDLAISAFESYEGLHGLRSVSDIEEEEDVDPDTAWDIYVDEREGWLDYEAREYTEQETN